MTRKEQINSGKVWIVYDNGKNEDNILFEGTSKSKCLNFIREKWGISAYKTGKVRLAKVIWEKD